MELDKTKPLTVKQVVFKNKELEQKLKKAHQKNYDLIKSNIELRQEVKHSQSSVMELTLNLKAVTKTIKLIKESDDDHKNI